MAESGVSRIPGIEKQKAPASLAKDRRPRLYDFGAVRT